ncbi:MvdC/MvdD family ATP grasp protein [uncultured Microscilla sp.]|uniref:MvdC/MvdD family ATP grasp protein n=1 Tax=uncultured Microscilla sp. TaxID=432653 RepID=UPI00260AA72C|nr:hypothetical protein [uncultured Microscilla sp.]
MEVLIVTYSDDDEGINNVTEALQSKGANVYRFNTNYYPTQIQLASHYINNTEQVKIISEDVVHNLAKFDAVWYRRIRIGQELPEEMADEYKIPAIEESKTTFWGTLASWGIGKFVLDAVADIRRAENKQLQLKVANRLGLRIPATLITNSAQEVKAFAHNYSAVISKMQYAFSIYDGTEDEYKVYSHKWQPEELEDMTGLEFSPMIFQEYVEKECEFRVAIVGEQIFCGKIPSQQSTEGQADWRKDGSLIDDIVPYDLPASIQLKLLHLMDYFGLNYGAVDLIKTPEGKFVFLEVNPVGEFSWLDQAFNNKISEAIANVLLNRARRRNSPLNLY